jgi:hypothetical protein
MATRLTDNGKDTKDTKTQALRVLGEKSKHGPLANGIASKTTVITLTQIPEEVEFRASLTSETYVIVDWYTRRGGRNHTAAK